MFKLRKRNRVERVAKNQICWKRCNTLISLSYKKKLLKPDEKYENDILK